jgi:hypothetical protein
MTTTPEKMDKGFVFPNAKPNEKSLNLPDVVNEF